MPTINLPGTDSPANTSWVGPGSSFFIYSTMTIPQGRQMQNGSRNVYTQSLNLYVAGRSGNVSIRPYFAGAARGSYVTYGPQGTPSKKTMNIGLQTAAGGQFQYGVYWGGQQINFRRASSSVSGTTQSSGSSSWNSPLSGTYTYAEAPPAPSMGAIDQITPTSMRVKFTSNGNGGADISGWKLQYSTSSSFPSNARWLVNSTGTSTITGLKPNTTYYFRACGENIVTTNAGSSGPWSSVTSAKTSTGAPSAPQNVKAVAASSTKTTVTWSTPSSNGGNPITGYRLQYSKNSNMSGSTSVNLGVVNTWTSPDLASGTWYFQVRAKNVSGEGTWSATVSNTAVRTGFLSDYDDSAGDWTRHPLKVYLGGTWTQKPVKRYVGGAWVALT